MKNLEINISAYHTWTNKKQNKQKLDQWITTSVTSIQSKTLRWYYILPIGETNFHSYTIVNWIMSNFILTRFIIVIILTLCFFGSSSIFNDWSAFGWCGFLHHFWWRSLKLENPNIVIIAKKVHKYTNNSVGLIYHTSSSSSLLSSSLDSSSTSFGGGGAFFFWVACLFAACEKWSKILN